MEKKEYPLEMCVHLSSLFFLLIPLGGFVGPGFIWLLFRKKNSELSIHVKKAINWQSFILLIQILLLGSVYAATKLSTAEFSKSNYEVGSTAKTIEERTVESEAKLKKSMNYISFAKYLAIGFYLLTFVNIAFILLNAFKAYSGNPLCYPISIPLLKKI